MRFLNVGTSALLVELDAGDAHDVMSLFDAISQRQREGDSCLARLTEIVPAARTLLVRFEPLEVSRMSIEHAIRDLRSDKPQSARESRTVDVPVIYDGEDLDAVAAMLGISPQQLVERHTSCSWTAAFVGFAPGFAYLTGDDPLFNVPRRQEPRLRVPAGSVGLAGAYSGVYPRASSGGWQLIGFTPVALWDERHDPPALIQPGDSVRFCVSHERIGAVGGSNRSAADGTDADADSSAAANRVGIAARQGRQGQQTTRRRAGSAPTPVLVHGLRVVRPGAFAIFEDDGRTAASMGVTASGAADPTALHRANALVGNPAGTPAIEIAGGGACFAAIGEAVVALAGARAPIIICGKDGSFTAIARQEAFILNDGDSVELGTLRDGLRDYLAVQGGFAVEQVLGSASGDTMSHIGPGPIRADDFLGFADEPHTITGHGVDWSRLPARGSVTELTAALGPRDDWFTAQAIDDLLGQCWSVTTRSDRVGLRLNAERPLERIVTRELDSEGTVAGAIEVPGNGQPVLFLRDHPVTGGYPVIAVLDPDSLALAGQLPAGALVRFRVPGRDPGTAADGAADSVSASMGVEGDGMDTAGMNTDAMNADRAGVDRLDADPHGADCNGAERTGNQQDIQQTDRQQAKKAA
ncbi:MAG: 5-oxoprolinase subunit PxpB [Bifidobacterium subtile]|jgi:KipI family sensor histidine kinase inhibitor|nr:5-oxoprolinase subunit PxpB [Bifidobacterium subtile]